MLDVVTVFAPRDEYPHWRYYLPMLELQRRTAEKFGHRHIVVTDVQGLREFGDQRGIIVADLPQSLMHLQLAGQIAYLALWSGEYPAVLVDADCLIGRDLQPAFDGARFDLGLTSRDDPRCAINNGAMYVVPGGKAAVLGFFRAAYELCGEHWGGDQEAISQAAAPVPVPREGRPKVALRHGARVAFLSMRFFNCTPRMEGAEHATSKPFVIHFKGEERKPWMRTYAERFILADR